MFHHVFNRNARSSSLLEIFFIAAVSTVLLTRFYLEVTNYPTLGGEGLHIAHMLPGGLLMLAGLIISFSFLGYRALTLASIVGGIGFGLFIDELGKFITKDNNYFFQPTVALLYLIFVGLFLAFRSLSRTDKLSQREYLINALQMMEEAVVEDLDKSERARVLRYLHRADKKHPLVKHLIASFESIEAIDVPKPSWPRRLRRWAEAKYRKYVITSAGIKTIDGVLLALAIWSLMTIFIGIVSPSDGLVEPDGSLAFANLLQLASSIVASWYILRGIPYMRINRIRAYELFTRGLLINIFVTQFFDFYREQFSSLPNFLLYVSAYVLIRLAAAEEKRLSLHASGAPESVPTAQHQGS